MIHDSQYLHIGIYEVLDDETKPLYGFGNSTTKKSE